MIYVGSRRFVRRLGHCYVAKRYLVIYVNAVGAIALDIVCLVSCIEAGIEPYLVALGTPDVVTLVG